MIPKAPGPESVLIFLQGKDASDHPGILDGYARLRARGEIEHLEVMPVFGPNGVLRGDEFWTEALDRASEHGTTLVVFQYYHSKLLPDPRKAIHALKALPSAPFVVSTLGDAFMNGYLGRASVPRSFLQAAEGSDLVTLTSMGALADRVARATRAPIVLSPNGVCQVRFAAPPTTSAPADPEFDVVFIGSNNASRNPLRPYFQFGRQRERLVDALTRRFGRRFAVFGRGWDAKDSDQGPVPFDAQAHAARRGRVVVGGVPFSTARYYTSNRPFIQMTSGVPVVDSSVPGVETLLRPDEHWFLSAERNLVDTVEATLELGDERRADVGRSAAEYVLSRHTQADRVAALLENVRRLRHARLSGERVAPHLPFFLLDVDVTKESRHATRWWPGIA